MHERVEAYVGTAGHSAWFSSDRGVTWVHPNSHGGMYLEARVWCFSSHSSDKQHLYAGTDFGLYCWDEYTTRWKALPSPMNEVWAIAQDPADAGTLIAGSRPAGLFRSTDAGANWQPLDVPGLQLFSDINMGPTRVTQILFDPMDPGTVWATIEIGGVFRSRDGGRTWQSTVDGLVSLDVHGIAITRDNEGGKQVLVTTNRGLHRSTDDGRHWRFEALDSPWQYTRAIVAQRHDHGQNDTLWLTNGDGPPGSTGRLLRSDDCGATWRAINLPGALNSTPWCLALHASEPGFLLLATNLGQLFCSSDGGDRWERLAHEFGEVRALHWRPVDYPPDRPAHAITVRPAVAAAA